MLRRAGASASSRLKFIVRRIERTVHERRRHIHLLRRRRRSACSAGRALSAGARRRCIVAIFFGVTLWALDRFFPSGGGIPGIAGEIAAIAAAAAIDPRLLRDRAGCGLARGDRPQPRRLGAARSHRQERNPVSSLLSKADIGITVSRGTMAVSGKPNTLTITTPLSGNPHHRPNRHCRRRRRRHRRPDRPARRRQRSASITNPSARPEGRIARPGHRPRQARGSPPTGGCSQTCRPARSQRQRHQPRRHQDQSGERGQSR